MELVIGGYAQGKLNYVLQKYQTSNYRVYDGDIPTGIHQCEELIIINCFHHWVRDMLLKKSCPEQEIFVFLNNCDRCVIISDEIGNGIVPLEPFEREYRERVGTILIMLAERAEGVERVICGIGQKIK